LRSIPLYAVLGNHDVGGADLAMQPDGLGAFYFFSSPLNGPTNISSLTKVKGTEEQVAAFKKAAGTAYPSLCNYSFDNGPVHILALDANSYVDFTSPALRSWISNDLASSKATWKIVVVHQPPFSSSEKHFTEQRVRLLSPLFEQCGVDMVFGGHVHNYQRTKPLTFEPASSKTATNGTVEGKFTFDENFDGQTNTAPKGIIYVVTGGGGASLYDPGFTDKPEKWRRPDRSWAPYTKKFVSDRHSFTLLEAHGDALAMRQFDYVGEEIERLQITKPAK
ncbi:MAG TPA: metallophosphoesterase, partial [Roseimicrobium sp.]|nr:metallophosphoesterase [Roseimicrobium sp.]